MSQRRMKKRGERGDDAHEDSLIANIKGRKEAQCADSVGVLTSDIIAIIIVIMTIINVLLTILRLLPRQTVQASAAAAAVATLLSLTDGSRQSCEYQAQRGECHTTK